jgi:PDZ domain-containing protein
VTRRVFSPGKLLVAGLVLVGVALALLVWPSNEYIFLPDRAHPVTPLVRVPGGHPPRRGGIYFVDVIVRKATLLERLFGGLQAGADLYPASEINPPGVNDQQRERIDLQDMKRSQEVAAAVALKAAGKKVVLRPTGALVDFVEAGAPAVGKIEPDDVITAVDGRRVRTLTGVFDAMRKHRPGDVVRMTLVRAGRTRVASIKTVAAARGSSRAVVGVILEPDYDIHLPIPVRIDVHDVGGPSAGLAFALDVYAELGHDILHGNKIAATGEIEPDGSVLPIGGVKQKTIGAREAGVDAFLVPAGDNFRDAEKQAHGLRIIPVKSFQQALRALATLPPAQ